MFPVSRRQCHRENPLFVGQWVLHKFKEEEGPWRVISVVKGFPDFYNIVYDCDVIETNSKSVAILTYELIYRLYHQVIYKYRTFCDFSS